MAGLMVKTDVLTVKTRGSTHIVDLTEEVQRVIQQSEIKQGILTLFVNGSTAALTTVEFEPGLVKDLQELFDRMIPKDHYYHHHERWNDDNGHSHLRASLLGPSLTIPFTESKAALGIWQQVVLVDFDTRPRTREVVVQILGE
jgi:secondary thiamine-phosphate synthase enzyme